MQPAKVIERGIAPRPQRHRREAQEQGQNAERREESSGEDSEGTTSGHMRDDNPQSAWPSCSAGRPGRIVLKNRPGRPALQRLDYTPNRSGFSPASSGVVKI